MKKTKFNIPIYNWEITVIKIDTLSDYSIIEKTYDFPKGSMEWFWGVTFKDTKNEYTRYVMVFYEDKISTITHECFHCLRYIYNDRGIKFVNNHNDEHQCYILWFLTKKVFDFLNKKV